MASQHVRETSEGEYVGERSLGLLGKKSTLVYINTRYLAVYMSIGTRAAGYLQLYCDICNYCEFVHVGGKLNQAKPTKLMCLFVLILGSDTAFGERFKQ